MPHYKDSKGNVMTHWVAVAFGEFDESPVLFRYPQVKGLQWQKHIVPALRRVMKTYFGLKNGGYFNVEGPMCSKPEHAIEMFRTTKRPRIDYNIDTNEFDILPPK